MAHPVQAWSPLSRKSRSPFTMLIVEDDATDTELLLHAIEQADLKAFERELKIEVRSTAEGALEFLRAQPVDLVVTDLRLPGMEGLDLVSHIQDIDRNLPVVVVTRLSGVQTAVEAMRRGAYDYVLKPVNAMDLGMRLHRAIRISEIIRCNSAFQRMTEDDFSGSLVGVSAAMQDVFQRIREASQVRSTVLITGETGTGKGLVAKAIHQQSQERDRPYQVIDCTTVPEGMMESELFGHVRGAFTGAIADKPGLIELANGGTVFLDEIGDLPLALQAKLLHVLEENEVRPVGGVRVKHVDMRFICATNQNLQEKVRNGTFRKDLYYRLAVLGIHVVPLKDRPEDIPVISRSFVSQFGREMGKPSCFLDSSAMTELMEYPWPGNVRELRNVLERAVMLTKRSSISGAEIRALLQSTGEKEMGEDNPSNYIHLSYMEAKEAVLSDFTSAYLRSKLALHENNISRAAEDSGIPRQHFSLLMKRYLGKG